MGFGTHELGDLVVAGRVEPDRVRVWGRMQNAGPHTLELRRGRPDGDLVQRHIVEGDPAADHTGAWTLSELDSDARYYIHLLRRGERVSSATFKTEPAQPPARWTFSAFSCHQPFASKGEPLEEVESMLDATRQLFEAEDVRFALMMGDQIYADYPPAFSLFNQKYFAQIAPPGRDRILDCARAEVRMLYQQRHRQFWGLAGFPRLQSALPCLPMLDDHEVVDNFGTHPDHATPQWTHLRQGALDAFFDYQAARVMNRPHGCLRPEVFDYGFTYAQAAFWMMDHRSQRRADGKNTQCYAPAQLDAFEAFIHDHRDRALLVLMTPIPLVHVEGHLANAASRLLGQGSDLHERWSHSQCIRDRDRLLSVLLAHARQYPAQKILLLGGDVHSGAAFQIDFNDGPRVLQLTSSAISNRESAVMSWASEVAAKTVSQIEGQSETEGRVALLAGVDSSHRNPFGDLNVGLIDVIDRGRTVGLRLRLSSHDGKHRPVTVYDSGDQLL